MAKIRLCRKAIADLDGIWSAFLALAYQLHFRGSATQLYALWYVLRHLDVWQRAILLRPTRSHAPQHILNGVNVWHL